MQSNDTILMHPVYFGPISYYAKLSHCSQLIFEKHDNYQKQTYRNRCYIATPEGKLLLNIPIKHTSTGTRGSRVKAHQKYQEVKIENAFNWQQQHWKSIQIAYRSSPFFEFYEDDFAHLFEKEYTFLMDFNLVCFDITNDLLKLSLTPSFTDSFSLKYNDIQDLRYLAQSKIQRPIQALPYTQVHHKHHGFLENLSILDLLFNLGPESLSYLLNQNQKT